MIEVQKNYLRNQKNNEQSIFTQSKGGFQKRIVLVHVDGKNGGVQKCIN